MSPTNVLATKAYRPFFSRLEVNWREVRQ
ncbi:hypothetical protein EMIT0P4_240012 [Pseudomonas sp. IT-P4]